MKSRLPDVKRLSMDQALALGPEAWSDLPVAGRDSPFRGWSWHKSWADSVPGSEREDAFALALQPGGTLVALLPLRRFRRIFRRVPVTVLSWAIGDDACPDHLELLCRGDADLEPLADVLLAEQWHLLSFTSVAEDAVQLPRLASIFEARGYRVIRRATHHCRYLSLAATWDDFLGGVSSHRRHAIRRLERVLGRDHKVDITFHDAASLDHGWQQFLVLHEQRWGERSQFADDRQIGMSRRFAEECARNGSLWLAIMEVDGEPGAALYGFRHRSILYSYQTGFNPKFHKQRVGQVLLSMVVRRAIEQRVEEFDFLRGDEPYKAEWAPNERACYEWMVFRGVRGGALRLLDTFAERRRKGVEP